MDTATKTPPTVSASDVRYIGRLMGCYLLASRRNDPAAVKVFACRASSISPVLAIIEAPVIGDISEEVTLRFDPLGLLRGQISQFTPGGFAVALDCTEDERTRLASKLIWIKKHANHRASDLRKHKRILPRQPHAKVFWPEKGLKRCLIMDISQSGVAVSADIHPPIGAVLAVGKVSGRVVRHIEGGFAIAFSRLQDLGELEQNLAGDLREANDIAALLAETRAANANGK
jgi:hypothetical protein